MPKVSEQINGSNPKRRLFGNGEYTEEQELYCRIGANIIFDELNATIDSLIQEIKQETVSVNQSTYAIKKLLELKERL